MRRTIGKNLLFVFFAIFLLSAPLEAKAQEAEKIFKTRLDNGLTVIIEEEHASPVVAIEVWVRVGSADEADTEAGISHVFEHMLFKGTKKRKVGEIARVIEAAGGDINAYTSFDNTVFHLAVPSREFATGLDVLSDAVQNSAFDPGELKKELDVVLEEIRMNEDSPGRSLYKSILSSAYSAHPYKRPVIGFKDTVASITRPQMTAFFRKWYIPNNMTIVIVGDVKKENALDAIKAAFRGFKKGVDPHRKRPVEPPQRGLKADVITQDIKEPYLGMAFHIPELKHPDTYAIDVLASVLAGGETSRLYKRLKIDETLVHGVSAYAMTPKEPGLFFITANLEAGNADKTISATIAQIKKLALEGPNPDELSRVKLNLESEFVYSRETMQGIAGKLGYYETTAGGIDYEKKYLDGIRAVTAADVKRAAKEYFKEENMTATMLLPKDGKDAVSKDSIGRAVRLAFADAARAYAAKIDAGAGKVSKIRLDNGMTLIVKEAHANPTVAFYAAWPGGIRFEEAALNGIGNFTAGMLTAGTKKRTREDIAKEEEEIAGGVSGFSGWNSTGASGKFLSMYFDKGLNLFADIIMNPVFPDEEIERNRKDVLAAIKSQEDNLPSYTFKLLYRTLYKTHPYGMPVIGTSETVSKFTKEDLISHHNRFFIPERMVLTIVGDVETNYATERVKAAFKDFTQRRSPLAAPTPEDRQTEVRETGAVKEKAQTNIGIGFPGLKIGDDDSYALKVLTEVLAGQGGRLFVNLRDRESLAYSLSAFSREGVDAGVFGVYIGASPDKKDAAIAGIMRELSDITSNKVTDDELKRAKGSLIGGYTIGLQDVGSQASDMANNELYGLGFGFSKTLPDKIEAVTADEVLRVGKKYITLDAYTISIVGPELSKGNGK